MIAFSLCVASLCHTPTPLDVERFGVEISQSFELHGLNPANQIWRAYMRQRHELESQRGTYRWYAREQELEDLIRQTRRVELCWSKLDDLCSPFCSDGEARVMHAIELRRMIGYVPYYLGEMPE